MSTINDVAKMAGVSAATVSHVVNKTRYVSPELVKRVEDAINALEFPPNFVVKKQRVGLAKTDARYVALIASNIHNPFQYQVEKEIEEELDKHGFTLIPFDFAGNEEKLDFYRRIIAEMPNLKGVVIFPDRDEKAVEEFAKLSKVPVVIVGKSFCGAFADIVLSDNFGGAYKAASHLIRSGHENIAIICADKNSESNVERINGYKKALEDNGINLNENYVITGLTTDELIAEALRNLLLSVNPPTALFAANYNIILSVFRFIEKNNIKCPEDLSIVGFNDFEWASLHNPPITTVAQDVKKIGMEAAEMLAKHIELLEEQQSEEYAADKLVVPSILKVRGTTTGIGRGPFGEKAASAEELQLTENEKKMIAEGNYTAAISFHYMGKSWMRLHEQGIRDVFSKLGIHLLSVTDAHFNPEMQCKQLEGLLNLEPNVIISIPTDNIRTAGTFRKIADSSTALVLIANIPDGINPGDYVSCVSVNERSQGRIAGHGIGEYMRRNGKKNIGIIRHHADFYATNQRDNAAEQIIAEEYPEIKICACAEFDSEESVYEETVEMMKKHPEIEGLYISWEGPAMNAVSALSDLKRNDVAVATADLEYSLALNMARGGSVKAISAQCPYEQGQAMALAAACSLIGKKVPSFIGLEPIYVTSENLLKAWRKVYKEEPPTELSEAMKNNPDFIE